ncbi:zn-finger domain-containing protein [Gigaspora margarita]|uniref:Zn-finger domain-containing protein n=1 Tax=Gigaspora margarita TaxID=4874 RepID=A0A8H4ER63_GIGMA|nr:zn-finger domain-containing protein [Gigaspora margarita]
MVLVTKYKLSNSARNAIISFFNKHSKHSTSPLPKNIRQEKEFMNNIKSNLSYKKTKVLDLDNTEMVKRLFIKSKIMECGEKTAQNSLPIGSKLLSIILYSDATNCDTLVNRDNLANTTRFKHNLVLRNHKNMQNCLDKSEEKSVYIESIPNYFWNFNDMNIYEATVINRMHHLDLGLFKHQINFTCSYDICSGQLDIDEFIQNKLLKLYKDWNNMYLLSQYKEFTDNDLKDFEVPKLYSWIYHTTDLIKKYGCLNGFSTETYKSLYKDFVKTLYYLSNKQNIEDQIMKMIQRQAIASKLLSRKPKNSKTINPFKFTNLI